MKAVAHTAVSASIVFRFGASVFDIVLATICRILANIKDAEMVADVNALVWGVGLAGRGSGQPFSRISNTILFHRQEKAVDAAFCDISLGVLCASSIPHLKVDATHSYNLAP